MTTESGSGCDERLSTFLENEKKNEDNFQKNLTNKIVNNNGINGNSENVLPLAVFSPCSNSHPFEERRIIVTKSEEQAIKIGRAVARFQPAINNAIFDCKVLSRNHAIMWYNNNQFYIKDTRSSNGTFVNNERLANSGEESQPFVLYSGDILQLGVEIVDNTKKVASGCVTCIITLINNCGEECRRPASSFAQITNSGDNNMLFNNLTNEHQLQKVIPDNYTFVPNDKLFIMEQYLKEARFRENLLGQKLILLEDQLATAQEGLENSWQALINEEHLLSRIEVLELQLALFVANNENKDKKEKKKESNNKNEITKKNIILYKEDEICEEINNLHEDCVKVELAAKDALKKAEEQVLETNMRLHDAENSLNTLEEENGFLRQKCNDFEKELLRQRNETYEILEKWEKERIELYNEFNKRDYYNDKMNDSLTHNNKQFTAFKGKISNLEESSNIINTNEENKIKNSDFSNNLSEKINENLTTQQEKEELKCLLQNKNELKDTSVFEKELVEILSLPKKDNNCMELKENVDSNNVKILSNEKRSTYRNSNDEITTFQTNLNDNQIKSIVVAKKENNGSCCVCNRSIVSTKFEKRSPMDIQVLLFSALPFILILVAFLFPIFNFPWPLNYGASATNINVVAEKLNDKFTSPNQNLKSEFSNESEKNLPELTAQ